MTVPQTVRYKENCLPAVPISNLLGHPTCNENRLPTISISSLLIKMTVPQTVRYKENCLPAVPISNLLGHPTCNENRLPTISISSLLIKLAVHWTANFIRTHLHSCRFFGCLRRLRGRRRVFQMLRGHRLQVILLIAESFQVQ